MWNHLVLSPGIPKETRCSMIYLLHTLRRFGVVSDKNKRHIVGYPRALILKEALRQTRISAENEAIDFCEAFQRHRRHQIKFICLIVNGAYNPCKI